MANNTEKTLVIEQSQENEHNVTKTDTVKYRFFVIIAQILTIQIRMSNSFQKIKTSALSRRLSIAKTTLTVGKNLARHSVANLFATDKTTQKQAVLSEQAQYFVNELGKLKGSVVKVGQMLALYGDNFLPKEIVTALHTLDNNTVSLDFNTIYRTIYNELGELIHDFEIDPIPIGTASLAQVHKATHKTTGQLVVLKVQYPDVATAIDSDLSLFKQLLKLTQAVPQTKELDEWFSEIKNLLYREVNYELECTVTERFFDYLKNDERFVVPKIYRNYCTNRLICMSFEQGILLSNPKAQELSQDRKNAIGQAALELVLKELFVWGEIQTDPNFGNYLLRLHDNRPDQLVLLDFGAIKTFDKELIIIAQQLFIAGYHQDKTEMVNAMRASNYPFFTKMSDTVINDLADVFLIATEGFAKPSILSNLNPDSSYLDKCGNYDWANSNLYTRTSAHAKRCMQSLEFAMPPKELMFISRKFIGAFALLTTLQSRTNADELSKIFINQPNPIQDTK